MSFTSLNQSVIDLRNAIGVYVGADALPEVAVRPPASENDEAAFLRLTSWCYALFFEAGKITLPYLLKLPVQSNAPVDEHLEVLDLVHALRTLAFHNLGLSDRDARIARRARDWQRRQCGTDSPRASSEWTNCFASLCDEATRLVLYCHQVVDTILVSPDDGEAAVAELRLRLRRSWPRQKFETTLQDIVVRLGLKLNIGKFINAHIARWQEGMEFLDFEANIERHMIRVIERDVLNHFDAVLPIDGNDMISLGVPQGPQVREALGIARELERTGLRERDELLEALIPRIKSLVSEQ